MLPSAQIAQFKNFGYVVVPDFTPLEYCESVIALARSELKKQIMPIEHEIFFKQQGVIQPIKRCTQWSLHIGQRIMHLFEALARRVRQI